MIKPMTPEEFSKFPTLNERTISLVNNFLIDNRSADRKQSSVNIKTINSILNYRTPVTANDIVQVYTHHGWTVEFDGVDVLLFSFGN